LAGAHLLLLRNKVGLGLGLLLAVHAAGAAIGAVGAGACFDAFGS